MIIKDMHTQKIVGNSFSKTIYTTIVLDALDNALTMKNSEKGLIVHSDRGS